MAVAVRVTVEKDNDQGVTIQEELLFISESMAVRFKNASVCFGGIAENMFHTPRCPEGLHGKEEKVCPGAVTEDMRLSERIPSGFMRYSP